jgi:hypothetical protein
MLDDKDDNVPGDTPKPGELHLALLGYSLAMHQLREEAIKSMAAATSDGVSSYEVQKYRNAMWAAQNAERQAAIERKNVGDRLCPCRRRAR